MPEFYLPYPWLTALGLFALSVLWTVLWCWLLYYLTKCAIRDGIKESGLTQALRRNIQPTRSDVTLPDMRAD